ncbi:Membrane transport protein [Novymonas esmeraldas]|uniref:Membrane transport protein n=1 Tax=Novymonas esmeraldas TaxID=1808958 RepID=A0AAW0EK28_9TRYP
MDMLGVTFIAVSKVIVAVLVGVFTTNAIPNSTTTLRDFGYLISTLLITSLTLSNTAKSVNLEVLIRCSVLILFSLIMIACGLLWGMILGAVLFRLNPKYSGIPEELRTDVRLDLLYDQVEADPGTTQNSGSRKKRKMVSVPYVAVVLSEHFREIGVDGSQVVNALEAPDERQEDYAGYRYATWVGCSTQNGVTLPLSLMANIASSVPFVDMTECAVYIFVFTISYILYLFSACPAFVGMGQKAATKQRLIREILLTHRRMMTRSDATTQTLSLPVHCTPGGNADAAEDVDVDVEVNGVRTGAKRGGALAREGDPLTHAREDTTSQSSSSLSSDSDGSNETVAGHDEVAPLSRRENSATQVSDAALSAQNSFTQTMGDGTATAMSPNSAAEYAYTMATAEQLPYDWAATGLIRVKYESEVKALRSAPMAERARRLGIAAWALTKKLMQNPPFLSVLVGIFIGIIPPVRALFYGGPLELIMDAVTLIGQGSIPSSLLLLGANLVGSSSAGLAPGGAAGDVRHRHAEQNTEYPLNPEDWRLLGEDGAYARWYDAQHTDMEFDSHESFSLQTLMLRGRLPASMAPGASAAAVAPMVEYDDADDSGGKAPKNTFLNSVHRTLSLSGIHPMFVWGIILFRLLLAPAFSFCLLVFLINTMPFLFGGSDSLDKSLIMVLTVELAAPTAINSALHFNARQFMTYPWAKMLFFQYIVCAVTMVMWATIGLTYVSRL